MKQATTSTSSRAWGGVKRAQRRWVKGLGHKSGRVPSLFHPAPLPVKDERGIRPLRATIFALAVLAQFSQSFGLNLPYAFAGNAKFLTNFF